MTTLAIIIAVLAAVWIIGAITVAVFWRWCDQSMPRLVAILVGLTWPWLAIGWLWGKLAGNGD